MSRPVTLAAALCAAALAAAPQTAHTQVGTLGKRAAKAATAVTASTAGDAATVAAVAGGVSPAGQMAAAVARGARQAAAARAAREAGIAATGQAPGGVARAAASVAAAGGGPEDAAEARQEARAREFERFQTCVAAAIPSLGQPAPTSPEIERVDAELQALQQQGMTMAMTGQDTDAARVEALQDRVLVLTAKQMVLRYPALGQRCGPAPSAATR